MATRVVLVPVDTTAASDRALMWAAKELYKPGDVIHILHVAKTMEPACDIQHMVPGTTFAVPNSGTGQDRGTIDKVKAYIRKRFVEPLDALKIPHELHLYLDTDNAPASAIGETIQRVASEAKANLIVVAAHNKSKWEELFVGSVTRWCLENCQQPLMVVRNYGQPPEAQEGSAV